MVSTFKQSIVTFLILLIFIGIAAFIRHYFVGKYLTNMLQKNKYPQEDVKRIELSVSFGIAIIVIIALVLILSLFQ